MAIALVSHTKAQANGTVTTGSIDTTGANLLVLVLSQYPGAAQICTISDNKGNTWTGLTAQQSGDSNSYCRIFYAKNPTVGTGHTFTSTDGTGSSAFDSIFVAAFSGADTTAPFDVENGGTATTGTSQATGSITPSVSGELIIAAINSCNMAGATLSIDSSLTITDQYATGPGQAGGMAYLVQTSAAAINPTWSWTGSQPHSAAIASFKAAASGGPTFTAVKGDLTLSGKADAMTMAFKGVKGDLVLNGKVVSLGANVSFTTVKGDLTLSSVANRLAMAFKGVKGDLTLHGYAAALASNMKVSKGSLTLGGKTLTFSVGKTLTLPKGDLTLAGKTGKMAMGMRVAKANLTLTGYSLILGGVQQVYTLVKGDLTLNGKTLSLSFVKRIFMAFPPVPEYMSDEKEHRRQMAKAINGLRQGKVNAHIDAFLTAGATSTTLTDARISPNSAIIPMAISADGSTAVTAGIYFTGQGKGSVTVNHANAASHNQLIRFLIVG